MKSKEFLIASGNLEDCIAVLLTTNHASPSQFIECWCILFHSSCCYIVCIRYVPICEQAPIGPIESRLHGSLYRSVNKRRKPEQKSRSLIIEICLFVRASGRFLSEWTKSRPDHHCGNSIDSFAFKFSRVMPVS